MKFCSNRTMPLPIWSGLFLGSVLVSVELGFFLPRFGLLPLPDLLPGFAAFFVPSYWVEETEEKIIFFFGSKPTLDHPTPLHRQHTDQAIIMFPQVTALTNENVKRFHGSFCADMD